MLHSTVMMEWQPPPPVNFDDLSYPRKALCIQFWHQNDCKGRPTAIKKHFVYKWSILETHEKALRRWLPPILPPPRLEEG